jgi:transcriptional regulator with XRE-family HTH domain
MAVMNMELIKLGLRIRASRKILGRSQKDFAEQCGLDRVLVEWNAANVT